MKVRKIESDGVHRFINNFLSYVKKSFKVVLAQNHAPWREGSFQSDP